jgi:hypothetical protein
MFERLSNDPSEVNDLLLRQELVERREERATFLANGTLERFAAVSR